MRIGMILNWAYYPFMLVFCFRSYAFAEMELLMAHVAFITVVAFLEIQGRRAERQVKLLSGEVRTLKGALIKSAEMADEQSDALADIHSDEHPSK